MYSVCFTVCIGSCKTRDFHIWVLWVKAFEDTNLKINRSLWSSSHYFYYFLFEQYSTYVFWKNYSEGLPSSRWTKTKYFWSRIERTHPPAVFASGSYLSGRRPPPRTTIDEWVLCWMRGQTKKVSTHTPLTWDRSSRNVRLLQNALRNPIRHAWLILVRRDFCCCCNTSIQWFRCKW